MSRSKNYYQGMHLGRVQRSEYDDARMRDHARQEARLGESLKTVDRAKNVMKRSMEADKQMFIKAGSQVTVKAAAPVHGAQARMSPKVAPRFSKLGTEPRVKRFSVTDMPSDLARSNHSNGRLLPRPISLHELNYEPGTTGPLLAKDYGSIDKLLESNSSNLGSGKASYHLNPAEVTARGTIERFNDSSAANEEDHRGIHPTNRTVTETSRQWRSLSRVDQDKANESRTRQRDNSNALTDDLGLKKDDQTSENSGEIKNQRQELGFPPDQDTQTRFRKRSTLWETLSTPKHTSLTKSKRSQIEMEFTKSNMAGSKSPPALFHSAKVKPPTGQGRQPVPRSDSVQGRQVDGNKGKQSASSGS